jgi:hypothetical protein
VNGISASYVIVEPGGTGVVAHVGLHALGCFADRLGLGDSLSARIPLTGELLPVHDRGKVLVHTTTSLAFGGRAQLIGNHYFRPALRRRLSADRTHRLGGRLHVLDYFRCSSPAHW